MISLIHLSDIHYITDAPIEQKKVLDKFIKDLSTQLREYDTRKTYLVISGDLVQTGSQQLYDSFQKNIINKIQVECNLPIQNMIFVPGNHDIEQDYVKKRELELSSFKNPIDQTKFNDFVNSQDFKESHLAKKFKNYENFHVRLMGAKDEFNISGYETSIMNKIDIFCLNTALCSFGGYEGFNDIGDKRILNVNTRKIREWLDKTESNNHPGKILIMHHPIEYLSAWSETELKNILRSLNSLIVLTGHTHEQDISAYHIPNQSSIIYCRAPQLFCNDRYQTLGYSIIHIDEDSCQPQYIKYREWSSKNEVFVKGVNFAPNDGIYVFGPTTITPPLPREQKFDYKSAINELLTNNSLISDNYINIIRILEQLKSSAKDHPTEIFDFLCKYIKKRTSLDEIKWFTNEKDWLNLNNDIKVLKFQPYDVQLAFNILYKDCIEYFKNINKEIDLTGLALQNINLCGMNIKNTDFSYSFMQHSSMFHIEKLSSISTFENCKFNNTFLDAANMNKAKFINCTFINTNFRWSNMYGCKFINDKFYYCNMTGAILSEAHLNCCAFNDCTLDASEIFNLHLETETLFQNTSFCFAFIYSGCILKQDKASFNNCNWAGINTDVNLYENHGRIKRFLIFRENVNNSKDEITFGSQQKPLMDYKLYKSMKYLSIIKTLKDYCLPNSVFDEEKEIKLFIEGSIDKILT